MVTNTTVRVGWFLALRQLRRGNRWTTLLIIFVMCLTFLNLVVVSGILVGLIAGAEEAVRQRYTSDVLVSSLTKKTYIGQSQEVIANARRLPGVENLTARYVDGATVESNYATKTRQTDLSEEAGTVAVGIDPRAEDAVTHLSDLVIEGEY